MAYLKFTSDGTVITRYLSFNKTQEVNVTVKTALDGTEYLTRFGTPVYSYEIEMHVNHAGKGLLMSAFDTLAELEVGVRIGTFRGRIKDLSDFKEEYHGWYSVTATLASVSEVNER